jgi:ribonuclease R
VTSWPNWVWSSRGPEPEPKDFADLAAKFEGRPDAELLSTMLLRSMRQAIYQADNIGHFGLALKSYAHFTSPIRRYPDLILHRAIKYQTAKEQQGNLRHKWTRAVATTTSWKKWTRWASTAP